MLASINAAIATAAPIVNGFNGSAGLVSLAENISHIDVTSKLVINNNEVCLGQSLALQAIELIGLAPGAPAVGAVTQAHFDTFRTKWADTLGVFQLYTVAAAGGVWTPAYRNADVLSLAAYTARAGNNAAVFEGFAAGLIAHFQADQAAAAEFSGHAHFIALNVVRASHHRMFSDGHNGYTQDTQNPAKRSHSICALAGASKDASVQWLSVNNRCHDMHHHLTHQSLSELADGVIFSAGAPGAINVPIGTVVNGAAIAVATTLADICQPGEAAVDRHPFGMLGISALILGLEAVGAAAHAISMKYQGGPGVAPVVNTLLTVVKSDQYQQNVTRDQMKLLIQSLNPMASFAVGILKAAAATRDWVESHPALESYSKRCETELLHGMQVGRGLANVADNAASVLGMVNNAGASFAAALDGMLADANVTAAAAALGGGIPLVNVVAAAWV